MQNNFEDKAVPALSNVRIIIINLLKTIALASKSNCAAVKQDPNPQALLDALKVLKTADLLIDDMAQANFDSVINKTAPRSIAETLRLLKRIKLLTDARRQIIANHQIPYDVYQALWALNRSGLLTDDADRICDSIMLHKDPCTTARALEEIDQANFFNVSNCNAILKHEDPTTLTEAFFALNQADVLDDECAQEIINDALKQPCFIRDKALRFCHIALDEDVNRGIVFRRFLQEAPQEENGSAAFHAITTANADWLHKTHSKGVNLSEFRNEHGETLIHFAVRMGQKAMLSVLHNLKIDIDALSAHGATALHYAAEFGKEDLLEELCQLGANTNIQHPMDGSTPAYLAAENKQKKCLKTLKQFGADLDKQTFQGKTPAYIAAEQGFYLTLETLIKLGANPEKPDHQGEGPVFAAAKNGHVDALKILAKYKANLNSIQAYGLTPIFFAVLSYRYDAAVFLLEQLQIINITFFLSHSMLRALANSYGILEMSALNKLLLFKDPETEVYSITLEEIAAMHLDKDLFELLTNINRELDDELDSKKLMVRYQPNSFFRPYQPSTETKLLVELNRHGNIEARHNSVQDQEAYDQQWGLVLRH